MNILKKYAHDIAKKFNVFTSKKHLFSKVFICVLLSIIFSGCVTSTAPTYYILELPQSNTPHKNQGTSVNLINENNLKGPTIALLPVVIPSYLDITQIVSRTGSVGFLANENQRWAENLPFGIARILCASITENLKSIEATVSPLRMGLSPDYSIHVEIRTLEGTLGGEVQINALWTLEYSGKRRSALVQNNREKTNVLWQSFYKKTLPVDFSYEDYVHVYSDLIDSLGKEIALIFTKLYEKEKK